MMRSVVFLITGKVQGVFFRDSTKRLADQLGITGWVRNCSDGSVEIVAQGNDEVLERFERWCWEGPASAQVENVARENCETEDSDRFEIR